jgi:hypothetical protein
VVAEHGGGERQERDANQQQQVDPQHGQVPAPQVLKGQVVSDPEPPDHPEAQPEAEELRPQPAELVGQLGFGQLPFWHGEFDDQQGDGDGEDGVAEERDPFHAHRVVGPAECASCHNPLVAMMPMDPSGCGRAGPMDAILPIPRHRRCGHLLQVAAL